MSTENIKLSKGRYVLTSNDDLYKLYKSNIIELDKTNLSIDLKEIFNYPFQHDDLVVKIESNLKYIFIISEMINSNLYMLTIFEKGVNKPHSIYCNFKKITFEQSYIYLTGENDIDNKTIFKDTCEIIDGILEKEDIYQKILESKEYIDTDTTDFSVTACSHDEDVYILCIDNSNGLSIIYMNDLEINSFGIMPYFVERENGIFYQNEEFEWYYNDILLDNITNNCPQFGEKYILDYLENEWILYKLNEWDKCNRCNIKIPKNNKCDFCNKKYCDECKPSKIIFYNCKNCNKCWCIEDTSCTDTYCEENKRNGNCENCGN